MLDLCALSDDACDNLISIFLKARPSLALDLIDLAENEPDAEVSQGRFRGRIKSWWPVYKNKKLSKLYRMRRNRNISLLNLLVTALRTSWTNFYQEKGYGFLDCDQTYAVYGCDIYINRLAIGLFQKNDEVHFSVELNKEGKPQGKNLLPVTIEAKRRQLMAACDPQFDLEGYLAKHQLGPYAQGETEKKRSSRSYGPVWGAQGSSSYIPPGPYSDPWKGKSKSGMLGHPGMMKGKGKGKDKGGWDNNMIGY